MSIKALIRSLLLPQSLLLESRIGIELLSTSLALRRLSSIVATSSGNPLIKSLLELSRQLQDIPSLPDQSLVLKRRNLK